MLDADLVPLLLGDQFFLGMSTWIHPVWRRKHSLAPQVEGEAGSQVTMATRLSLGASRHLHTKNKKAQTHNRHYRSSPFGNLILSFVPQGCWQQWQVKRFFPPLSPASAANIVSGDKPNNIFQLKGDI